MTRMNKSPLRAKAEEKKRLLQLTIKEIKYGRQDILINLFYLPAVNSGSKNRSELLPDDKATRKFEDEFIVKTEQGKYGKYKINIQNLPLQ